MFHNFMSTIVPTERLVSIITSIITLTIPSTLFILFIFQSYFSVCIRLGREVMMIRYRTYGEGINNSSFFKRMGSSRWKDGENAWMSYIYGSVAVLQNTHVKLLTPKLKCDLIVSHFYVLDGRRNRFAFCNTTKLNELKLKQCVSSPIMTYK